jgi:hypothetical protein
MTLDVKYGDSLGETVEASLSSLLHVLNEDNLNPVIITTLVNTIPEPSMQFNLLSRLPIYGVAAAIFHQSLARKFLNLSPSADLPALLTCLRTRFPFTAITRDISNEHTRLLKYAILIFDVAIGHPPKEQGDMTKVIIRELQIIHQRIIDARAAFVVRTETKQIIHRVLMRLQYTLDGKKAMESLDRFGEFVN